MKVLATIAVCLALNLAHVRFAAAGEQAQAVSSATTQSVPPSADELHFVSVLTFDGEIVAVEPARRLVTLKGPGGELLTLEAEKEEDLAGRKVGERLQVRYFEGAQIEKREPGEATPVQSLKGGMISEELGPSGRERVLSASVERIDARNQEITLKGSDGSLETIMVSNPAHLSHIRVGDRVVIARPQGLALSLERKS